ncbi:hypothetical protein M885DRAFT_503614 [Pelagophyceae sp. CCMP2097]|nr:hypothetical protein M885DRAFT_503614 [Pelagophyceae sp. CCMP2097]
MPRPRVPGKRGDFERPGPRPRVPGARPATRALGSRSRRAGGLAARPKKLAMCPGGLAFPVGLAFRRGPEGHRGLAAPKLPGVLATWRRAAPRKARRGEARRCGDAPGGARPRGFAPCPPPTGLCAN